MLSEAEQRLVNAWSGWFQERPSYFVTLALNYHQGNPAKGYKPVSKRFARWFIREWSYRLDYLRLGGEFYKRNARYRTKFVVVPENPTSNVHWHGLVQMPEVKRPEQSLPDFPAFLERCWLGLVRSGSFDCQPHRDEGALAYSVKGTRLNDDGVVTCFELWSEKTRSRP